LIWKGKKLILDIKNREICILIQNYDKLKWISKIKFLPLMVTLERKKFTSYSELREKSSENELVCVCVCVCMCTCILVCLLGDDLMYSWVNCLIALALIYLHNGQCVPSSEQSRKSIHFSIDGPDLNTCSNPAQFKFFCVSMSRL
jgi:hypothetical protein